MVDGEPRRASADEPQDEDEQGTELAVGDQAPMSAGRAHGSFTMIREEHRSYKGPLPDPETLEAYKRIDSRFPDAILSAFQEQGAHRHEMEKILLTGSERRANRGQWLGTAVIVFALGGGLWVTLAGQPVVGVTIFGATLAVGALSYVFGDYRQKDK